MDVRAALDAFDDQLRRNATPDEPDGVVEREDGVVRMVSPSGWYAVIWSALAADAADAAIQRQISRFAGLDWEWKHYSYDQPADLPDRLRAAGLTAEPAETLMLAEVAELDRVPAPPAGVHLVDVVDEAGVDQLVRLHRDVFGVDRPGLAAALLARLGESVTPVLAVDDSGRAVAAARIEYPPGTDFAGLWGGGTLPAWRGRGIFRALVAHRAALAAARGIRWLQVDAMPTSRPILQRLGFTPAATVTAWVPAPAHPPAPRPGVGE